MSDKVRFALVGAGGMGRFNAERILTDGRGEIVAVCDMNNEIAKQASKDFSDSAVFSNIEDLLSSKTEFDAAVVSTTNVTHAPISVTLLEAGKSVYCEKPPASDVAGAENIVAAASKSKGTFMFGFNQCFDPWGPVRQENGRKGRVGHYLPRTDTVAQKNVDRDVRHVVY